MKLADLTREIKDTDLYLAPGSETVLWGRFLHRMKEVTGIWSPDPDECGDAEVDDDEAEWWRAAYALYHERGGEFDDIQSLFDAVVVDD